MSDALTQLNLPDETKDMLGLALALLSIVKTMTNGKKSLGKVKMGFF